MKVCVIIPALNEAPAIASVVKSIPVFVDQVIVVDNGSTDGTGAIAAAAGAEVICVEKSGYGRSCLAGVDAARDADVIVFMDGDGADDPDDMEALVAPICTGAADFVVGSRIAGTLDRGALTIPQRVGNTLACFLMRCFWRGAFTDLGPFRAIKMEALKKLSMGAPTYGWTVEMQVRALKRKLRYVEVPVHYRARIGISKISGTVKGVVLAGAHILGVIAREAIIKDRTSPSHHC